MSRSPTKVGSSTRHMVDTFAPPIRLLVKIGAILDHVEKGGGESQSGHHFDLITVRSLLADREVQDWLDSMRAKALLPPHPMTSPMPRDIHEAVDWIGSLRARIRELEAALERIAHARGLIGGKANEP